MSAINHNQESATRQYGLGPEIRDCALFVSEHVGRGMDGQDMIALRDNLLALAERAEHMEESLVLATDRLGRADMFANLIVDLGAGVRHA